MSLITPCAANAVAISSGKDLQEVCSAAAYFSECVSYLELVHKTVKTIGRMNEARLQGIIGSCGPEQGIDTVPLIIALRLAWLEYADIHPERLHRQAPEEVLLAYEERWPCKN